MLRTIFLSARNAGLAATAVGAGVGAAAYCDEDKEARGPSFDPEALERGAKALREINKSPYAKKVIELSKEQEKTKQVEAKSKQAEYEAAAKQAAVEAERVRWEEQKKLMQQDAYNKQEVAKYNNDLAVKRQELEHQKQRERNQELVALQEQATKRQEAERRAVAEQIEAERRATEKYKSDLEGKVQRERALAEAEGRIRENRENEDVNRRTLLLTLEEERKKLLEAINATFGHIGSGVSELLADKAKLGSAVAGLTLLALGVYSTREGVRVAGSTFERWFGTPSLVRETSRKGWGRSKNTSAGSKSLEAVQRDFSDVVLPKSLHDNVRSLAAITANTRQHGAPFRHMMFYGPPGTGKTMAAKRLARTSGLDYAIMSGGDVAPLGGKAVTQIHELFDWAETSRKGLLLFIDEADAFLGRRGEGMSEGLRGALNAILFRTGDQSRDFAVVLATNRPGDLDPAVIDRMDEALEFPLPSRDERKAIIALYLEQYITQASTATAGGRAVGLRGRISAFFRGQKVAADAISVEGITEKHVDEAAKATEGFSGRELAKMIASIQTAVYGSKQATLTPAVFQQVVQRKVKEHAQRQAFVAGRNEALPQ
mmetsp:Transcript_18877/g.57048  ORF Transcript_18877/g.57048 Transcript_18877/m.57048 type:complete len:601 (-) Transcript_18877:2465-4267(-)